MSDTASLDEVPKPRAWASFFQSTRQRSIGLFPEMTEELSVLQVADFASPVKWHLAHTTWFFDEFFLSAFPGHQVDSEVRRLFNSYYNSVGEQLPRARRGDIDRPRLSEVLDYRKRIDSLVLDVLGRLPESSELWSILEVGLHHEMQHQELMVTDLKYNLFHSNQVSSVTLEKPGSVTGIFSEKSWISEQGLHQIGAAEGDGFSYDNERIRHRVYLEPFAVNQSLVSNHDYRQFVSSKDYNNPLLWHDDGWHWRQAHNIEGPLYWQKTHDGWKVFDGTGNRELPANEPVCHISYYEAAAFAEFCGARLPTEAQWETTADRIHWGQRWEWTQSAYLPYPGFRKEPGALGEYNGKFMVNQMVLRGASVATPPGHSRVTYRNFFHPESQWQFSGIRLARDCV